MEEPTIQHWLVGVARTAGLDQADTLDVSSSTDLQAAWDLVAMATRVSDADLAAAVAAHYRLDVADLEAADAHASRLLPASVAKRFNVLPLRYSDRTLAVASADPVSMEAEKALSSIAGRSIHFEVAPPGHLASKVAEAFPESDAPRHELPPLQTEDVDKPLILIVDDDPGMRALLRAVLDKGGYRVREAEDGAEALEALAEPAPPALVTLDVNMGDVSGLDVLRKIRSTMSTANVPVVVATGSDDPAVEMELFEAGADDFVVKPVDAPRFLLRIQAVLRRRSHNPLFSL